jgi:hypothetical protein
MKRRTLSFVALLLVAQGLLGMDCVDGVTPDCSDAQCGPPPVKDASSDSPETFDAGADANVTDAGDEDG